MLACQLTVVTQASRLLLLLPHRLDGERQVANRFAPTVDRSRAYFGKPKHSVEGI